MKSVFVDANNMHAMIWIPIISVGVFGVSMFISAVLNNMPFLKKYIV